MNRLTDRAYISVGLNDISAGAEDHRYIFPASMRVISISDGQTIEPQKAPLRDLVVAPPGRATSRIVKLVGEIGGTGGQGGWFAGNATAPGPAQGTFYTEGAITNKDDLEAVLQRIANFIQYRGMVNLRVGHNDDRFMPVALKKWTVVYTDGTDRMAATIEIDFEAPDPYFRSGEWQTATLGASGSVFTYSGGTIRTWPRFSIPGGGGGSAWIGVKYTALPGSPVIIVQFTAIATGFGISLDCDPRRRGIWHPPDSPDTDNHESVMTASMNAQNTVGDDEMFPYLMPGAQQILWSNPPATNPTIFWRNFYAF